MVKISRIEQTAKTSKFSPFEISSAIRYYLFILYHMKAEESTGWLLLKVCDTKFKHKFIVDLLHIGSLFDYQRYHHTVG